jgi:hypothetical protein
LRFFITGNQKNGPYEKYKVPDMDDKTMGLKYREAQRTVTYNHV